MSRADPLPGGEAGAVLLSIHAIRDLGLALLRHAGAPSEHAAIVIDHLVTAERMGLESHGLMRVAQYLEEIQAGVIDPAAEPEISRTAAGRLTVDGRRGFGQVVGMRMVDVLRPVADESGIAMVGGRHLGHTGRVGAYPEALARAGLVGFAVCNGSPSGHWVAAFGGREGRISTNPMAMAWPVDDSDPVVADFSTAVTAEGVVRVHRDQGRRVPEGTLRDAAGRPTDDPAALYEKPRGAIQPLGGPLGYRGTALALFVEVLTTLLNGDRIDDRDRKGTDMTLLAIAPQAGFGGLASELSAHIRSSTPLDPERPVLMPGDREWARAASDPTSIRLATGTWAALRRAAAAAGLDVPSAEPAASAP
jgi:uncharacterized oxidoreductase